MASGLFLTGLQKLLDGTHSFDGSETYKLMLVASSYSLDKTQTLVDDGTTADLLSHEITATGYVGGWGGADRMSVTVSVSVDTATSKVICTLSADQTFADIGGASNDTIGWVALVNENATDDTNTVPIAIWDVTNLGTSGNSITADVNTALAGGNIQFSL